MPMARVKAILEVLSRGHEEKLAALMLRVFGAGSLEECSAIYDTLGAAERASLDEAIENITRNAGAAFQLGVENELR